MGYNVGGICGEKEGEYVIYGEESRQTEDVALAKGNSLYLLWCYWIVPCFALLSKLLPE